MPKLSVTPELKPSLILGGTDVPTMSMSYSQRVRVYDDHLLSEEDTRAFSTVDSITFDTPDAP